MTSSILCLLFRVPTPKAAAQAAAQTAVVVVRIVVVVVVIAVAVAVIGKKYAIFDYSQSKVESTLGSIPGHIYVSSHEINNRKNLINFT